MAKAVLVMDMPECCADCRVATSDLEGLYHCAITDNYYSIDESLNGRDSSCPLLELPEKRRTVGKESENDKLMLNAGYNACLDEILKECDAYGTH
jgi:hypothetical protein